MGTYFLNKDKYWNSCKLNPVQVILVWILLLSFLLTFAMNAVPGYAAEAIDGGNNSEIDGKYTNVKNNSNTNSSSNGDGGDSGGIGSILGNLFHELLTVTVEYPFKALLDSIRNTAKYWVANMVFGTEGPEGFEQFTGGGSGNITFVNILNNLVASLIVHFFKPMGVTTNIMSSGWNVTKTIAIALVPLVILLTIMTALRSGASSITGTAEAREAIIDILVSIGVAFSSYWLITQLIKISTEIAQSILSSNAALTIFGPYLFSFGSGLALMPGLVIILVFMVMFVCIAIVLNFAIGVAALQAMYAILTVLAPIVFIVSAYGPLNWLRKLWIKALTFAMLLAPINAIIIMVMNKVALAVTGVTGIGSIIARLGMYFGCASLLITINGMIGKMMFSGAATAIQKGADAAKSIASAGSNAAQFGMNGGMSALSTAFDNQGGSMSDGLPGSQLSSGGSSGGRSGGLPGSNPLVGPGGGKGPLPGGTSSSSGRGTGRTPKHSAVDLFGPQATMLDTFGEMTKNTKFASIFDGARVATNLKHNNAEAAYARASISAAEDNKFLDAFSRVSTDTNDQKAAVMDRVREKLGSAGVSENQMSQIASMTCESNTAFNKAVEKGSIENPYNNVPGINRPDQANYVIDYQIAQAATAVDPNILGRMEPSAVLASPGMSEAVYGTANSGFASGVNAFYENRDYQMQEANNRGEPVNISQTSEIRAVQAAMSQHNAQTPQNLIDM